MPLPIVIPIILIVIPERVVAQTMIFEDGFEQGHLGPASRETTLARMPGVETSASGPFAAELDLGPSSGTLCHCDGESVVSPDVVPTAFRPLTPFIKDLCSEIHLKGIRRAVTTGLSAISRVDFCHQLSKSTDHGSAPWWSFVSR